MKNWETLIAENSPAVWQTLWRLLGERADVEDCFQETFVSAWKLAERQTVECWPAMLCRLATARALDRLRQRFRQVRTSTAKVRDRKSDPQDPAEVPSADAGPPEQAIAAELAARLRQALAQLPSNQAEAFSLHALLGWSQREVGERLKLTENAVGVTIHRARQRLQELLSITEV